VTKSSAFSAVSALGMPFRKLSVPSSAVSARSGVVIDGGTFAW
jgi:hypothetical protein